MSRTVRLNGEADVVGWKVGCSFTITGTKDAGRNAITGTGIAAVAVRSAVNGALTQVVACL